MLIKNVKQYISRQFIYPHVELPASEDLSEFVVIVTGASRGTGKAIVETLISKGSKVAAVSRSYEDLIEAFPKQSESLFLMEGDIAIEKDVVSIVAKTIDRFGKVNVVVNNAGINLEKPIEGFSLEEFDSIFHTNMRGAFLLSKSIIPHMKKAGDGFILNIGSKISHNTNVGPHKTLYTATKYAIEGFSFALNRELKSFGIRVACLMPGTINTFVSLKAEEYLSPYEVAEVVSFMIKMKTIDFESMVIKSKKQNI